MPTQFLRSIFALIVTVVVSVTTCYPAAQAQELKPSTQMLQKSIGSGLSELATGAGGWILDTVSEYFDSWGLSTINIGLDEGVIAQVIFKVNRKVEKNPYPTNGRDDWLVKDVLKIGFRFGYGLVVSGDVSYARQYTLVYPVATKRAGLFHNKFIFNLLLPYTIHKNRLPERYVAVIEDFIEGRGRLKLGGSAVIPIGVDNTASVVRLSRTFISHREKEKFKIFEDKSHYTELASELYTKLLVFQFPLLEMRRWDGVLKRTYYEISTDELASDNGAKALDFVLQENNFKLLRNSAQKTFLDDKFHQSMTELTLFGLVGIKDYDRVDDFTEYLAPVPRPGERFQGRLRHYLQIENRNQRQWTLPFTGERNFKRIRIKGMPSGEAQLRDASMKVLLHIRDERASVQEFKTGYVPFSNFIAGRKDFIRFDPARPDGKKSWGEVDFYTEFVIRGRGLDRLLRASKPQILRLFRSYQLQRGYAHPDLNDPGRFRRGRIKRRVKKFIKYLHQAQQAKSAKQRLKALMKAVKRALYRSRNTYSPILTRLILDLAQAPDNYLKIQLRFIEDDFNQLKESNILINQKGLAPSIGEDHLFIWSDPSELFFTL